MFTITYLKGNSIASFLFSDDIVDFKCVVVGKKTREANRLSYFDHIV